MGKAERLKNSSSQTELHVRRPSMISASSPELINVLGQDESNGQITEPLLDNRLREEIKAPLINHITIEIIACTAGWYLTSLTLSLYNKWMFDKSKLNFPFPILITSFHQLLLSILSLITIVLKPSLRPNQAVSWRFYITHIIPCSMASAGDIGAGNMSFRYISLTTYTMVKSSSIAFVLLFGVIARLEKFSYNLLGIVLLMSCGVTLMVDKKDGDANVDQYFILGFCLVLLSACMSGLRWVFTQLLLHKNHKLDLNELPDGENDQEGPEVQEVQDQENKEVQTPKRKKNPIFTIYQLSPPMFCILFIIGLFIEGFDSFMQSPIWTEKGIIKSLILLLIPGVLVFFMTLFEFGILQRAQVITLSIAGVFKELLTIMVSHFVYGDSLTLINFFGLLITIVDIVWYNYYRYTIRQKEHEERILQKRNKYIELEHV